MRVLYLTNNPNLGSTIHVVLDWLLLGRADERLYGIVGAQQRGPLSDWLERHEILHRLAPMPVPGKWPSWLWHAWHYARWAKRERVQLVHCQEHNVYPFGRWVAGLLGVPVVCTVQFYIDRDYASWAFAGRRAPDALVFTSESQQRDCAASIADLPVVARQHVVPLGLDMNQFGLRVEAGLALRQSRQWADDAIVIGTASALRPRKRIHDFIRLVQRLSETDRRIHGVIAGAVMPGDESYGRQLEQQVADSGLGDRLKMIGNLDDIEPFMQAVDVFISTSEYETFGMSVCEAMTCRCLVAGYAGGSVAEVIGDAGIVVPTGDLDGMFVQLQQVLSAPEKMSALSSAARRRVADRFDARRSLAMIEEVYRQIV